MRCLLARRFTEAHGHGTHLAPRTARVLLHGFSHFGHRSQGVLLASRRDIGGDGRRLGHEAPCRRRSVQGCLTSRQVGANRVRQRLPRGLKRRQLLAEGFVRCGGGLGYAVRLASRRNAVKHSPVTRLQQRQQLPPQRLHVPLRQGVERTQGRLPDGLGVQMRQHLGRHPPKGPLQRLNEQQVPGTIHHPCRQSQQRELQLHPPAALLLPLCRIRQGEAGRLQPVQLCLGGPLAAGGQQLHGHVSFEGEIALQQPPPVWVYLAALTMQCRAQALQR